MRHDVGHLRQTNCDNQNLISADGACLKTPASQSESNALTGMK